MPFERYMSSFARDGEVWAEGAWRTRGSHLRTLGGGLQVLIGGPGAA